MLTRRRISWRHVTMHRCTAELAQRTRSLTTYVERVAATRGAYAGSTCVILSCGPSLSIIHPQIVERLRSPDIVTLAVKQAIKVHPLSDWHVFNRTHLEDYAYASEATMRAT